MMFYKEKEEPELREELFENPDGSPVNFDTDYWGKHRRPTPVSGPFELYREMTAIPL